MTDRAEIERLLRMTGRTLEGLPKQYSAGMVRAACERVGRTVNEIGNMLLHQSDVIELLVGALIDALDERDQLLKDVATNCAYCVHINVYASEEPCSSCMKNNYHSFKWRGIQPPEEGE